MDKKRVIKMSSEREGECVREGGNYHSQTLKLFLCVLTPCVYHSVDSWPMTAKLCPQGYFFSLLSFLCVHFIKHANPFLVKVIDVKECEIKFDWNKLHFCVLLHYIEQYVNEQWHI